MSEHIGNDDKKSVWKYDKEKLQRFRSDLKKHLTNEYLTLSDRKDSLESDATQIRVEIERRDRTLFPANEHGDARKYFSPLNLTDLKDNQKSEKEKELNRKLSDINKETAQIEERMSNIMDFLRDLDDMVASYADSGKESDPSAVVKDDASEKNQLEEDTSEKQTSDDHTEDKMIDRAEPGIKVDDNLKTSLEQLTAYYMERKPALEILLEYNSKQEKWGMDASKFIITQIGDQIYRARKKYNISMVLLEVADHNEDNHNEKDHGGVDQKELCLTLSYDCEKEGDIKSARIAYQYEF